MARAADGVQGRFQKAHAAHMLRNGILGILLDHLAVWLLEQAQRVQRARGRRVGEWVRTHRAGQRLADLCWSAGEGVFLLLSRHSQIALSIQVNVLLSVKSPPASPREALQSLVCLDPCAVHKTIFSPPPRPPTSHHQPKPDPHVLLGLVVSGASLSVCHPLWHLIGLKTTPFYSI